MSVDKFMDGLGDFTMVYKTQEPPALRKWTKQRVENWQMSLFDFSGQYKVGKNKVLGIYSNTAYLPKAGLDLGAGYLGTPRL